MGYQGRHGPETRALLLALARIAPEYPETLMVGPWRFVRCGADFYRVVMEQNEIVMTGADVVTQLRIPFPFRWLRTDFYHTDAAGDASQDAVYYSIQRPAGTLEPLNAFMEILITKYDITDAEFGENWGENFDYEPSVWNLLLNSTNTDLIFPIFYIRRLPA